MAGILEIICKVLKIANVDEGKLARTVCVMRLSDNASSGKFLCVKAHHASSNTLALAFVFLYVLSGCRGVGLPGQQSEIDVGRQAADALRIRVNGEKLYPWTTVDRLAFYPWKVTDEFVHVQISEIHVDGDGADPQTHPTIAFFKLDRTSGQWWVSWPPGEGWLSFEYYAYMLHTQNQRTWGERQTGHVSSRCGKYTAFVHRFDFYLPPGFQIDVDQSTKPYAHLWITRQGSDSIAIPWIRECRGVLFHPDPLDAYGGSLVPNNLQWDSTERYLYYEFDGGSGASAVWRVDPEEGIPRYVSATRESFGLLAQEDGPDWVICNQARNGQWLWFVYTPKDILEAEHAFSNNQVSWPLAR